MYIKWNLGQNCHLQCKVVYKFASIHRFIWKVFLFEGVGLFIYLALHSEIKTNINHKCRWIIFLDFVFVSYSFIKFIPFKFLYERHQSKYPHSDTRLLGQTLYPSHSATFSSFTSSSSKVLVKTGKVVIQWKYTPE